MRLACTPSRQGRHGLRIPSSSPSRLACRLGDCRACGPSARETPCTTTRAGKARMQPVRNTMPRELVCDRSDSSDPVGLSRSVDRGSTRHTSQRPRSRVRPARRRTKPARSPRRVSPVRRREAAERKTDRRRSRGCRARGPTNRRRPAASIRRAHHANGRSYSRSCRRVPTSPRRARANATPLRANLQTGKLPPQTGKVVGPATAWVMRGNRMGQWQPVRLPPGLERRSSTDFSRTLPNSGSPLTKSLQ